MRKYALLVVLLLTGCGFEQRPRHVSFSVFCIDRHVSSGVLFRVEDTDKGWTDALEVARLNLEYNQPCKRMLVTIGVLPEDSK